MPVTEEEKAKIRALNMQGMEADDRRQGIVSMPGIHPDFAAIQLPYYIRAPKIAPADQGHKEASKEFSRMGLLNRFVRDGMDIIHASMLIDDVFRDLPETQATVDYDRLDAVLTRNRFDVAAGIVEKGTKLERIMSDIDYAGTTLIAALGGLQQGLFGAVSGESPSAIIERVFPDGDIRMPDGTEERVSLVRHASKGVASGTIGLLLEMFTFGTYGSQPEGNKHLQKARVVGEQLANTEWRDDLITGSELIEYIRAYGKEYSGEFWGPRIPDPGTPERAEWDAYVKEVSDQEFARMDDTRQGRFMMAGEAGMGAILDIFVDPVLWISSVVKVGVSGARLLTGPAARARVLGAVADRTRRMPIILKTVDAAKDWVNKSESLVDSARGVEATKRAEAQLQHAEKFLKKNLAILDEANDMSAWGESVRIRTHPRIHPDHLEPLGRVYLSADDAKGAAKVKGFEYINKQVAKSALELSEAQAKVTKLNADIKAFKAGKTVPEGTQGLLFDPEDVGVALADATREVTSAKKSVAAWKETKHWFTSRMNNEPGMRTGAFFREEISKQVPYESAVIPAGSASKAEALRGIENNMQRGLNQDAPIEEILQWERTYTDVLNDRIPYDGKIPRSTTLTDEIIASALDEQRLKAAQSDPTPTGGLDGLDPGANSQRQVLGTDITERAGEVARYLQAGGSIDDIAWHGTSVELYNNTFNRIARPHSGTELRGAAAVADEKLATAAEWLGKDPVETVVEAATWQQKLWEKFPEKIARALHPDSYFPRANWIIQGLREDMRLLQSMNPRLYTRMHNAFHAEEQEIARAIELFNRELRMMGVYDDIEGVRVLNPQKDKVMFDIGNMDPTGDDFIKALNSLSEAERRSLRRIREEMAFIGDKLGISLTDRSITGYLHHTFDARWMDQGTLIHELQGLPVDLEIFSPMMQLRRGHKGYTRSLSASLDIYIRLAARKLYMEPLIADLESEAARHIKLHPEDKWYGTLIEYIVRNLKGEQSTVGFHVDRLMANGNIQMRAHQRFNVPKWVPGVGGMPVNPSKMAGATLADVVGPGLEGVGQGLVDAGSALAAPGRALGGVGAKPIAAVGNFLARPGNKLARAGGHVISEGVRVGEFGSIMAGRGMPLYRRGDASRTAMALTSMAYASTLGGSSRYLPMAVATGFATSGSRIGIFNTLEGILKTATGIGVTQAKQAGLQKQFIRIMEDAMYTKLGNLAANMPSFNGVTVVGPSISATENYIRSWTYHGTVGQLLKRMGLNTWDDAIKSGKANAIMHEAVRITEETHHLFGQSGKPPIFKRLSKSASAAGSLFLSFVPKQFEEVLVSQMRDNPGKFIQYMMISGYIQRVFAKVGIDVSDYVGMGFLPHNPEEARSIATETMMAFMTWSEEMNKLATGVGDPSAATKAGDALLRSMTNFIPLAMAAQRNAHRNETFRIGRIMSGRKTVRDVNLGDFQWDDKLSDTENVKKLVTEGLGEPGEPTELAALLSGMTSTMASLEREKYQGSLSAFQQRLFRKREIVRALYEARDRGDTEAFTAQMELAIDEGMLSTPDMSALIDRVTLELLVPRLMRFQNRGDQQMFDSMMESMKAEALYDFRFNWSQ